MTAFWVGAAQFLPVYHVFHDYFKVPTECCVMAFLGFYALLVWIADRNPREEARPDKTKSEYCYRTGWDWSNEGFVFYAAIAVGDL